MPVLERELGADRNTIKRDLRQMGRSSPPETPPGGAPKPAGAPQDGSSSQPPSPPGSDPMPDPSRSMSSPTASDAGGGSERTVPQLSQPMTLDPPAPPFRGAPGAPLPAGSSGASTAAAAQRVDEVIGGVARQAARYTVEELGLIGDAARNPESVTRAQAQAMAVLTRQTTQNAVELTTFDVAAGQQIRLRWERGWRHRFKDPAELAGYAIDYLQAHEDSIEHREEYIGRLEMELRSLRALLDPAQRVAAAQEKVLRYVLLARLNGITLSPGTVTTLYRELVLGARSALETSPPAPPTPSGAGT